MCCVPIEQLIVLDLLKRGQFRERHKHILGKRCHEGTAQRRDMAEAAEIAAHVAGKRAHIGALAAFHLEFGGVFIRAAEQRQAVDFDLAGRPLPPPHDRPFLLILPRFWP